MRSISLPTFLLAGVALCATALTGCGDERAPVAAPVTTAPSNDVPDWVNDPTLGGKTLGAYGVAAKMLSGEAEQVKRARLGARQELASMLNSKIQSVVKDWVREGGVITSQDNAQAAMTSFESATRNVVNQNLEGSQQRARYADPKNGQLYVWMVINGEVAAKIAEGAKVAARENKEIRAHMAAKIEAEKAFADLDKMIDKQLATAP